MKITPISGFPEFLPAQRIVEQHFLDVIRETFELHGFPSIETRAVEPVDRLLGKGGDADKEIYGVTPAGRPIEQRRSDRRRRARPALRPHRAVRPLRAGERRPPVVPVPPPPDPEGVARRAAAGGPLPRVHPGRHRRRRRRRARAALRGRDAAGHRRGLPQAPRRPDGHPGQQPQDPRGLLPAASASTTSPAPCGSSTSSTRSARPRSRTSSSRPARTAEQADQCLALAAIRSEDLSLRRAGARARRPAPDPRRGPRRRWPPSSGPASTTRPGALVADLKIARGLDYYTGTVYETQLVGHESWGSFCSGGRYDSLASDGKTTYPGVGISIGVSRLLGLLHRQGAARPRAARRRPASSSRSTTRTAAPSRRAVATALRARGIPCEVAPKPAKFGKQIRYAERRGIPYVWFPGAGGRRRRPGQGHPLRRPGRRRGARVGASGRGPATRRSSARGELSRHGRHPAR